MLLTQLASRKHRQRGSTLVVTMMILILIMMLAVSAMVTSDTQFRLAGNLQFEDVSMNRAETSVATAENWLVNNYQNAGFDTYASATPHLHPIGHLAGLSAPNNDPLKMTWSDSTSQAVTSGDDTQRYIIEMVSKNARLLGSSVVVGDRASSNCNQVNTYLITSRGTSIRGATKFIQSYFSVLNC
jgi:Tfp pilus assembly protein PilX